MVCGTREDREREVPLRELVGQPVPQIRSGIHEEAIVGRNERIERLNVARQQRRHALEVQLQRVDVDVPYRRAACSRLATAAYTTNAVRAMRTRTRFGKFEG
jgi:hypothetical protein